MIRLICNMVLSFILMIVLPFAAGTMIIPHPAVGIGLLLLTWKEIIMFQEHVDHYYLARRKIV